MAEEPRLRLGRGLAALIGEAGGDAEVSERNRGQQRVPVEFVRPNPKNPRKIFAAETLDELAQSIREKGILQPIIVRGVAGENGMYEIVAGERRWRAAQRAEVHTIPIIVVEASDKEAMEFAIIENVQRTDLNALEEAEGYAQLIQEFSYTQADLGRVIGKSRSHVANTLRLTNLSGNIKAMISDGRLTAGHARALLSVPDPDAVALRIVSGGLSVRDAERIAQVSTNQSQNPSPASPARINEKTPDTTALEKKLGDATGVHVAISHRGEKGEIRLNYKTLEQLDELCRRLLGET